MRELIVFGPILFYCESALVAHFQEVNIYLLLVEDADVCHIMDVYGWSNNNFPCCLNIFEFIFSFLKCSSGEARNIFSQVHFHIPRRLSYVNK